MSVACYQLVAVLLVYAQVDAHAQTGWISPCPDLFRYEPLKPNETDRWYATVTILSDLELSGVWLRLIFDKTTIQLGNWFGGVTVAQNYKEYVIKNRMQKVPANTPYKIRFFVKYLPEKGPPMLQSLRIDAKTAVSGNATPSIVGIGRCSASNPVKPVPVDSAKIVESSALNPVTSVPIIAKDVEYEDFWNEKFLPPKANSLDASVCSTVFSPPDPPTTANQVARVAKFPWHAALYHGKDNDLTFICQASLITRYHVITVAHCVTRRNSLRPLKPETLIVYLGKFYLRRWPSPGIQDRIADRITVHPEYNADQGFTNDIAIVKLLYPVEVTHYVRPVCLWNDHLQIETVNKTATGTVVGWDFDENLGVAELLVTGAEMSVVSQTTCSSSFPEFHSKLQPGNGTFCAGFINGSSLCRQDAGAGMVFSKAATAGTVWQLRGLASIISSAQNQLKCNISRYVVFTNVAQYLDWIKAIINN